MGPLHPALLHISVRVINTRRTLPPHKTRRSTRLESRSSLVERLDTNKRHVFVLSQIEGLPHRRSPSVSQPIHEPSTPGWVASSDSAQCCVLGLRAGVGAVLTRRPGLGESEMGSRVSPTLARGLCKPPCDLFYVVRHLRLLVPGERLLCQGARPSPVAAGVDKGLRE